jgi:hypothetical protein
LLRTQDDRLGTPQGVPTQGFARQAHTSQGVTAQSFTARRIASRGVANRGFTTEDILWALGIWSAIICLSPVIVFYMLMVA